MLIGYKEACGSLKEAMRLNTQINTTLIRAKLWSHNVYMDGHNVIVLKHVHTLTEPVNKLFGSQPVTIYR